MLFQEHDLQCREVDDEAIKRGKNSNESVALTQKGSKP